MVSEVKKKKNRWKQARTVKTYWEDVNKKCDGKH